jgi:hypothetical protein
MGNEKIQAEEEANHRGRGKMREEGNGRGGEGSSFFFLLFWWYWGSRLHTCEASIRPLEPLHHPKKRVHISAILGKRKALEREKEEGEE